MFNFGPYNLGVFNKGKRIVNRSTNSVVEILDAVVQFLIGNEGKDSTNTTGITQECILSLDWCEVMK